jgi:hypothetical protein
MGFPYQAIRRFRQAMREGLYLINFQRFPFSVRIPVESTDNRGGKELFMAPETYLWPSYFYSRYKIYCFDPTRNDCIR